MSSISAIVGFSSVVAFAWHDGEREQAIKKLFMAFPARAVYQSAPHQLAVLPRGCTTAGSCWSMTGWLPPLPSPKCQRGCALMSELAPGNLLQGSKAACSGARDPELDPFVIIIIVVIITTTIVIFQHCFSGFIKEDLHKKENLPFELVFSKLF